MNKVTLLIFESNKQDSYKKVEVARSGDLNLQRSPSLMHSDRNRFDQFVEDCGSKGLGKNVSHIL